MRPAPAPQSPARTSNDPAGRWASECRPHPMTSCLCVGQRVSRREKRREDSSRNRKEQLLQELSVINKVIEKKKQKKSSSRRSE